MSDEVSRKSILCEVLAGKDAQHLTKRPFSGAAGTDCGHGRAWKSPLREKGAEYSQLRSRQLIAPTISSVEVIGLVASRASGASMGSKIF